MSSTLPTTRLPHFFLENKDANIKALRDGDFHYSWALSDNQLLTVEYIPDNHPSLTVFVHGGTVEQTKTELKEIDFEIQED